MSYDETFLQHFEACAIPHQEWNHSAYLKVAYLYLTRQPFEAALEKIRSGVKAHNLSHGIQDTPTSGYHETMTCVFMHLVHTTLRQFGHAGSADAFFDAQSQLGNKRIPLLFYSRDLIMSAAAKAVFVEPDLAALPKPLTAGPSPQP